MTRLEARVEESHETSEVSRVEDDNHVLHVGAVSLDVLTEFFSDFAVTSEEVFTSHTFLTGSTTRRDDVFGILEGFSYVGSSSDASIVEAALAHFFSHTFGREYVVEADVGSEAHHERTLYHVGADHASCANDYQFFVS